MNYLRDVDHVQELRAGDAEGVVHVQQADLLALRKLALQEEGQRLVDPADDVANMRR